MYVKGHINVDDTGCLWVVEYNAVAMWHFDPSKPLTQEGKAQKCGSREDRKEYVFEPRKYCSGPKPFLWTKVEVVTNASLSDFSKAYNKCKRQHKQHHIYL